MIIAHSIRTQRDAQNRILRFSLANALAVGLSFGSVVPLLALHYGAGDVAMTLLYAAIHVANFSVVLVPFLFHGHGTTRLWYHGWLIRAIISIGYLLLPLLASNDLKIVTLLLLYYAFHISRSIGMSAYYSVLRSICPAERIKSFSAHSSYRFNWGVLIAGVIAFVVLRHASPANEEFLYMLLLLSGVTFNFISTRQLKALPETGMVEKTDRASLVAAWSLLRNTASIREVVPFMALLPALTLCHAFMINFFRNTIGYSPAEVYAITVAGLLATIGGTRMLRMIGDHVATRVTLAVSLLLPVAGMIAWFWAPGRLGTTAITLHMILFSTITFGLAIHGGTINALQSQRLPGHLNAQITVFFQCAAVVASLLVSGWLPLFRRISGPSFFPHEYSYAALTGAVLCLLSIAYTLRMKSERGLDFHGDIAMLSPANLLTMYRLSKADNAVQPPRRELLIESAMSIPSKLSEEFLLASLRSSDFGRRYQAYRLLNRLRLPSALDTALEEASDEHAPLRREAITLLGLMGNPDAIPLLQRLLDASPPRGIAASLCKSLLRLGAQVDAETLRSLYLEEPDRRSRLEILIGLASSRNEPLLIDLIDRDLRSNPGLRWIATLFVTAAELYSRRETALAVFDAETEEAGRGFSVLLQEFSDGLQAVPDGQHLMDALRTSNETAAANWLNAHPSLLPEVRPSPALPGWILLWCAAHETAEG